MTISLSTLFVIIFLVMLAVLGHGVWHHWMVGLLNLIVGLFTGAHVYG